MKTNKEIKEEIRKICTYHNDDGTSGYNLSEAQFYRIFNLFNEVLFYQREEIKEMIESIDASTTEQEPVKPILQYILENLTSPKERGEKEI